MPLPDVADDKPQAGSPGRLIALAVARVVATTGGLVAIYYVLPLDHESTWAAVTTLAVGLAVLIGLVIFQVWSILRSQHPGVRAVEALASCVPLFLLLFAGAYVVIERLSGSEFSEPLSRTDALYFTVTVFSTVGFGDITPKAELARLVVTGQMIADVAVLGLAIKVIVGAVRSRRSGTGS